MITGIQQAPPQGGACCIWAMPGLLCFVIKVPVIRARLLDLSTNKIGL